ncbi:MAG: hypothetical protein MMC33_006707 [Icmadophila ericetorum]|nr:hypothetical protein [Icmadophila ericetorum]
MSATLNIALQNETTSSTVYAYITGSAINNNFALFLLQSDGKTYYYPSSPTSNGTPLAENCAIALGAPGSTTTVTIPYLAGARVWFSIGTPLTFSLNPGPGLVEPSVTNHSDPNINTYWDFCEFTFNSTQLFANISYVDFVSIPIALNLINTSGGVQHVSGMASNGLNTVCAGLTAQNNIDGAGWNSLIVQYNGANLRALSPNDGIVLNANLFSGYWQPYVNKVWSQYTSSPLSVNTQAQWGIVEGEVTSNALNFSGVGSFTQPAAKDIFSCSTGPFAAGSAEMGALTARISAAFNRSTLLIDNDIPSVQPLSYYQNSITNHYARIVHAANLDGRGYAFPYDDVGPSGGADQSGSISDGAPLLWTITVGGGNATASAKKAATTASAEKAVNGHVEL